MKKQTLANLGRSGLVKVFSATIVLGGFLGVTPYLGRALAQSEPA